MVSKVKVEKGQPYRSLKNVKETEMEKDTIKITNIFFRSKNKWIHMLKTAPQD